ncbi:MAG: PEGA domain-containing protein [Pseudomonadota bacterium]
MRVRAASASCIVCLIFVANVGRAVQPDASAVPEPTTAPSPDATAEARRHFKLGIRLYQDTNYPGALAEFEAAYAAKPGPSSLQNVALCQKALFRYREAAQTLAQLLRQHGSELSDGEKKAVNDAITELDSLVGSVVINVEPSDAKVTVDGRALSPAEQRAGIELNVGEHTVVADEPGYARLVRVVSVASGQKKLPVELKLKATDGFVHVVAVDPRAAIALDGVTLAFHEWRGGVKPDTDHLIQVFRDGFDSYESTINIGVGKTLEVLADLGARIPGESTEPTLSNPKAMPAPPPRRATRGYYGLLTLGVLGLGQKPLALTSTRASGAMGTVGLRAGYRIWAPIAGELLLDFGKLNVADAKSDAESPEARKYSLSTVRFGPNLRLMTTGKALRFSTAIGAGVVHHKLTLDPVANSATLTGGSASGDDPYFLLELGLQWSLGHFLLGAEVVTLIDGATSLNKQQVEGDQVAFGNTNTLPLFGLSIHGGYSLW